MIFYTKEKLPPYKYMVIDEDRADVIIYEYLEEGEMEVYNEFGYYYKYNQNCFRINKNDITEEMIASNPLAYIDYKVEEKTNEENISDLLKRQNITEKALLRLIKSLSEG